MTRSYHHHVQACRESVAYLNCLYQYSVFPRTNYIEGFARDKEIGRIIVPVVEGAVARPGLAQKHCPIVWRFATSAQGLHFGKFFGMMSTAITPFPGTVPGSTNPCGWASMAGGMDQETNREGLSSRAVAFS